MMAPVVSDLNEIWCIELCRENVRTHHIIHDLLLQNKASNR